MNTYAYASFGELLVAASLSFLSPSIQFRKKIFNSLEHLVRKEIEILDETYDKFLQTQFRVEMICQLSFLFINTIVLISNLFFKQIEN